MSDRLAEMRRDLDRPAGHGNAGLASNFIDLAHVKAKPGGVVALVLPITAVRGGSWRAMRSLLEERYTDIAVVTVAASGSLERAFSADTGMAEALIVATKRRGEDGAGKPALFVNLRRRPASLLEAAETARMVARLPAASASGRFRAGGQLLGSYVRAPLSEGGCAALREPALAETMMALRRGELRMPRRARRDAMPIAPLGELGERGLLDRDVGGVKEGRPPFREPFRVVPIHDVPNYPILWAHDAKRERKLIVEPDREGEARPGREERAIAAWRTADAAAFHPRLPAQFAEPRRLPHSGARARRARLAELPAPRRGLGGMPGAVGQRHAGADGLLVGGVAAAAGAGRC